MGTSEEVKTLEKNVKWVSVGVEENINPTFSEKFRSRGIYGILVSLGCITTVGILFNGLRHFSRRDGKKQQSFMRYRILSQGLTLIIAGIGLLKVKLS